MNQTAEKNLKISFKLTVNEAIHSINSIKLEINNPKLAPQLSIYMYVYTW